MTVIDYTWKKLVVVEVDPDDKEIVSYFRYQTHGGPTSDAVYADFVTSGYDAVWMLKAAQREFPNSIWEIRRFNYTLDYIPLDVLNDSYENEVRHRALKKLTEEEKRVLGL